MQRREMLRAASATLAGLSAFPLGWAAAAQKKRPKFLFYTRNIRYDHPPVHREGDQLGCGEQVLIELGKREGFDVVCSKDGRLFDGDLDRYDLIVSYACGDQTEASKRGTPPMTLRGKQRLLDAVAAGKGFVGFHSAADTFHSKGPRGETQTERDPYVAMLGGEFIKHGAQQEASLLITSRFPGAGNLGCAEGISFTDEWYALKNFAKDLHVILVQETRYMKGDCYQRPDFPCTWAHMHGKGRVFYTSLGHRSDIWTNPFFQAIALGGISWALGNVDAKIEPNIDRVTPKADQLTK